MTLQLQPPSPLDMSSSANISTNWKKFKEAYRNYEIAIGIGQEASNNNRRVAIFLHVIGEAGVEKYNTMTWAEPDDKLKIIKVIENFDRELGPKSNIIMERYKFLKRKQEPDESCDQFITQLRVLVKTCNYSNQDEMIRDQFILNLHDDKAREKLLDHVQMDTTPMSLDKAVNFVKNYEMRLQQKKQMKSEIEVNLIKKVNKSKNKSKTDNTFVPGEIKNCRSCGRNHKVRQCPAYGQTCTKCRKKNHFANQCLQNSGGKSSNHKRKSDRPRANSEKVRTVDLDDSCSSDSEYQEISAFSECIGSFSKPNEKKQIINMKVNGNSIKFLIDSGATCNVIGIQELKKALASEKVIVKKNKGEELLKLYNKKYEIKSLGTKKLACVREGHEFTLKFHIVNENVPSVIGYEDAQRLGFIKVLVNDNPNAKSLHSIVNHISAKDDDENVCTVQVKKMNKNVILEQYADLFNGLGNLGSPCKIKIDDTVTPVVHAPRKVPFALKKKLKLKLEEMEGTIIEKVNEPSNWVSSMVVVTKRNSKDLRICIDPTDLNKAIKRPHYPLPTIEEILPNLGKARIFSVLDAKNGFWQVELDEESSFLTTFNTPFGRYRWKRMPFGISSAPEEYQRRMNEALQNLKGVAVIADDILVYGDGLSDEEALINHDKNLEELLLRCQKENIKLNKEKMKIHLSEVTYIGHLLTKDGVRPDPRKVKAIHSLKTPTDVKSLRRFLGMVNYLAKFLPMLSEITQPLRNLEKKNVAWEWNSTHDEVFGKIKKLIAEAPVLKYFDGNSEITLQCDASMSGIGAVLLQNGQPVAYASKALTDTEQRYAQIEKELLAIVFASFRFEQYIYGKSVKIETDHKPLESIFMKPLLKCPKRLQRMLLQLQRFNLEVIYKPGSKMVIADTLSRDYLPDTGKECDNSDVIALFEEICSVDMAENVAITDERLEDIRQKSSQDVELQTLKETILDGWPTHCKDVAEIIRPYFTYRDELSVDGGLIFRGPCIVVPKCLRSYMIKQIHYAHTGIESTIRYGRDILFWPGMSADLKNYVSSCKLCNKYSIKNAKEPLKSHEFPTRPWSKVGMDIFTLRNCNYLILVDYYSSYFEINTLENLLASTVIKKIRSHFARYGIPDTVVSDCGTQFTASEFQKFAKRWSFKHVMSSPHHHQSNGKAENAVKIAKHLLMKAKEDDRDPQLALLEWRNTPTEGFESSPAQRFLGRRTRSQLPTTENLLKPKIIENVPDIQSRKLEKQAKYYNRSTKALKNLDPGEIIRLQPDPGQKEWRKGKVVEELSPRKYKIEVNGKFYIRNRKFLRKTTEQLDDDTDVEVSCDDIPSCSPVAHSDVRADDENDLDVPKSRSGREIRKPSYLKDYVCT